MLKRQLVVAVLGCTWVFAAAFVTIATVSLVYESGWGEMPAFAWVLLFLVFGVALPGLLLAWYKWARGGSIAGA